MCLGNDAIDFTGADWISHFFPNLASVEDFLSTSEVGDRQNSTTCRSIAQYIEDGIIARGNKMTRLDIYDNGEVL